MYKWISVFWIWMIVCETVAADTVGPVRSFPPEERLVGHTGPVQAVTYSPDGRFIVSGGGFGDDTLKIWDATSGSELHTFAGNSSIRSVTWSPDGRFIASGGWQEVKVWDTVMGAELYTLTGHLYNIFAITWSPDGRFIVSGSDDSKLKMWDFASGTEIHTLSAHSHGVNAAVWS